MVTAGATVVLGEPEWEELAREFGAAQIVHAGDVGRAAVEALLGRARGEVEAGLPGRLEFSGDNVFAGAHNPAGVEWLVARLPRDDYVICAAILAGQERTLDGRNARPRWKHFRRHPDGNRADTCGR